MGKSSKSVVTNIHFHIKNISFSVLQRNVKNVNSSNKKALFFLNLFLWLEGGAQEKKKNQ